MIAAIGDGCSGAALPRVCLGSDPVARDGWAIPAATDIAFALGVFSVAREPGSGCTENLLMALAIIDDPAIVIITALFYTSDLSILAERAAGAIAVLALLNIFNVRRIGIYILRGWCCGRRREIASMPRWRGDSSASFVPLKPQEGKSPAK